MNNTKDTVSFPELFMCHRVVTHAPPACVTLIFHVVQTAAGLSLACNRHRCHVGFDPCGEPGGISGGV